MNYRRNEDKLMESESRMYNNLLSYQIVTDVIAEPITVSDAKLYLKIDFDDEDAEIDNIIKESREQLEEELDVAFAPKTIKVGIRNELGNFVLPFAPVTEIVDVKDEDAAVLDAGNYTIKNGVLETLFYSPVFVTYKVGYAAGTLPAIYKRKLKERIAYNYEHRGDEKKVNNGEWL